MPMDAVSRGRLPVPERRLIPSPSRWRRALQALALAAFVSLLHWLIWQTLHPTLAAPDVPPRVAGLALSAYERWQQPPQDSGPSAESLARDVALLAGTTSRLRSYSTLEMPTLPALADQHGLALALGVWLGPDAARNAQEQALAIALATQHASVKRIIAGNETQLQQRVPLATLLSTLDALRASVNVPVSTAEPWHVWLDEPALAAHVDFITVHVLPYWEGVPDEQAVDVALARYAQVQQRFPDKPIVIGEIGWPSGGTARGAAHATPAAQAQFMRRFLERASALGLDYYLMEAFDQPWKVAIEGEAGPHWGVFDAYRHPKFAFAGAVETDPYWRGKAFAASALGLAVMLPFLWAFAHLPLRARLTFALVAQAVATGSVLLVTLPLMDYLSPIETAVWLGLMPALLLMALILIAQTFEFVELYWPGGLRRVATMNPARGDALPLVSVHVACSNEPPAMVIATLESLLALDWPSLEICVVDNNTTDPALWQPVAQHVASLARTLPGAQCQQHDGQVEVIAPGRRIVFVHVPVLAGFKAGALNHALSLTSKQAAWVAVVDADYRVQADWLRAVGGYFDDSSVAIVQAPQAHRALHSPLSRMMNAEYDGFFRNGMHHRHERNAIIQHGTMTLIRASALRAAGGWETRSICEDTELGLRLLASGARAVYVDRVFGAGLVPDDSISYGRQRFRWACGAMQIARLHVRTLLGPGPLSAAQRYHFVAGWLPWWGDTLHLLFSVAMVLWTIGMLAAPTRFDLPNWLFMLPLAAFFLSRLLVGPLLHARRVGGALADVAGAALAGMALSHTIATGVLSGLLGRRTPFEVTRKAAAGGLPAARSRGLRHAVSVRQEALLLGALLVCLLATALAWEALPRARAERLAWMAMLCLQALPYLAALLLALLSWRSRSLRPSQSSQPLPPSDTAHSASPAALQPPPSAPAAAADLTRPD